MLTLLKENVSSIYFFVNLDTAARHSEAAASRYRGQLTVVYMIATFAL